MKFSKFNYSSSDIKLYACYDKFGNEDLTLEIWNDLTNYPDTKFYFSNFQATPIIDRENQIFQWLLECASKMMFPTIAKQIVDLAYEKYITWENKK